MRIFRPSYTMPIPSGAKVDSVKRTVVYRTKGQSRKATLTDNGRMRVESDIWRIEFRDRLGRRQSLTAFPHEQQSRFLASRIEALVSHCGGPLPKDLRDYFQRLPARIVSDLERAGLLESQPALAKPLSDLVGMYEQALCARERSPGHVAKTVRMIREVFDACVFETWRQIADSRVEAFLRDLREGERHVSYRRSNAYLTACQGFANWIVSDRGWATESPLRRLKKLSVQEDRRRTRRALEVEQLRRLLQKTAAGPDRYGMTGRERYLLYRTACESGLRAGELRRLRKADFDFDAGTVTVRAERASKNKTTRQQALSPGLCAELRGLLESKLPAAKAFGGSYAALTDRTAEMLREDLDAAGLPYKDDQGNVFDFHSLRVETASLLIDAGVSPKAAQEVMRHSSIGLTMDIYAKVLAGKSKAQAVAALPDLSLPESQRQTAARTGTDDLPLTNEGILAKTVTNGPESTPEFLTFSCAEDAQQWIIPDSVEQPTPAGAIENAVLNGPGRIRTFGQGIMSPLLYR